MRRDDKAGKGRPVQRAGAAIPQVHPGRESGSNLFLLQDLTVQVAPKGRPYNPRAPISNIDTDYPVFDIRGSFVRYQCDPVYLGGGSLANAGKNCTSYDQPKAEGVCWKTTFGDWGCNMSDLSSQHQKRNVAPPQ